jgi:hypothetical protein
LSKVTFHGEQRLISINSNVSEIIVRVDLYSTWKDWAISGDNTKYTQAFRYAGGDLILDNSLSLETYVLLNGWKISLSHDCVFDGIITTDNETTPFVSNTTTIAIVANRTTQSPSSTTSQSSTYPTTSQIATAVREELSVELARIDQPVSSIQVTSNGGALTSTQANMLLEMYDLLGLDPNKPLIVTSNSRSAGSINQTIISDSTSTIVTRN